MDHRTLSSNAAAAARTRRRIAREGMNMRGEKLWSSQEDATIRSLFPDYAAIVAALPHRSYSACQHRTRVLGVVVKRNLWTARELSILRRRYPATGREELLELLPGRTWNQIIKIANRHSIFRNPTPYKATGFEIVDQIRARCRQLNYSMPDLDKMARSKRYFAKANWCNGYLHHRAIGRAVKVLFGDLKVDWK